MNTLTQSFTSTLSENQIILRKYIQIVRSHQGNIVADWFNLRRIRQICVESSLSTEEKLWLKVSASTESIRRDEEHHLTSWRLPGRLKNLSYTTQKIPFLYPPHPKPYQWRRVSLGAGVHTVYCEVSSGPNLWHVDAHSSGLHRPLQDSRQDACLQSIHLPR